MNTSEQSAPADVLPAIITESQIAAWLCAQLVQLDASGLDHLCVSIDTRDIKSPVCVTAYPAGSFTCTLARGFTVAEAYAELRKQIPTGADLAAQKRAQAEKLLAEAAAILNPPAPASAVELATA